jgi:rhodanese-related sulfurtransferase
LIWLFIHVKSIKLRQKNKVRAILELFYEGNLKIFCKGPLLFNPLAYIIINGETKLERSKRNLDSLYILLIIIVAFALYVIFNWLYQRKIVKTVQEDEFRAGYRKAQLIDVREPNEFEAGHVLGARNIPMSQIKMRMKEIRPDLPVYLYCQSGIRSGRAAHFLYRKGYKDLTQLKGGFKGWTGKVKAKK